MTTGALVCAWGRRGSEGRVPTCKSLATTVQDLSTVDAGWCCESSLLHSKTMCVSVCFGVVFSVWKIGVTHWKAGGTVCISGRVFFFQWQVECVVSISYLCFLRIVVTLQPVNLSVFPEVVSLPATGVVLMLSYLCLFQIAVTRRQVNLPVFLEAASRPETGVTADLPVLTVLMSWDVHQEISQPHRRKRKIGCSLFWTGKTDCELCIISDRVTGRGRICISVRLLIFSRIRFSSCILLTCLFLCIHAKWFLLAGLITTDLYVCKNCFDFYGSFSMNASYLNKFSVCVRV